MVIDIAQTLKKAAEERAKPKPLPIIIIDEDDAVGTRSQIVKRILEETPSEIREAVREYGNKTVLVSSLWVEYHQLSTEQKKLSTQIAHLVTEAADQDRLKQQYDDIESYQPQLQGMRDKIRYAEIHGTLPPAPDEAPEIDDINALKVKSKSLVEKRSKLKKKIALKTAKNPGKFVEWEKELAAADIEYEYVQQRIDQLESK